MVKISKEKWDALPQEMLVSAIGIQELFYSFDKMKPEEFQEVIDVLFDFNLAVADRTTKLSELLDRVGIQEETSNFEISEDLVNTMEDEMRSKQNEEESFAAIIPLKVQIMKLAIQERFAKANEEERKEMVAQTIESSGLEHE